MNFKPAPSGMYFIFIKFLLLFLFFNFSYGKKASTVSEIKQMKAPLETVVSQRILKIETDNADLKAQIQNQFQSKKSVTKEKILDFLVKQGYFKSRVIETPSGFSITAPFKMIFILKGNRFLRDYEIKKLIKANSANRGEGFEEALISSLKVAYQALGFKKISIKKKKVSKGWVEWVYLTFQEGPRIKIANISLTGLISRPSHFYVNFIKSHSSPLIQNGYFNKKDLETGYKNLIFFLKKNGYLQSRIYSDKITYKNNKAYITVNLDEGPLTLVKSITFSGNQIFTHSILSALMKSRIFEPLRLKVLEQDFISLETFYKNKGYLQMKILNKKDIISYSSKSSYVNIHINIQEGVQSRISKILIKGTTRMKESFIKKLLKFKSGEILSLKKIRDSQNALNALGVFSRVSIDFDEEEESAVIVSLKEKKPRLVRGGAGINTERRLTTRAYAEFVHRSLFGRGRSIFGKLGGQVNLIEPQPVFGYELSGVYQEIFLPGQNIKGNVGVSRVRSIFNYTKKEINGVRKHNIRFFIEKQFSPLLKAKWSLWDFETRQEFCIYRKGCATNLQSIGATGLTLSYDKRDSIFNPTEGLFFSVSGEHASSWLGSSPHIQFSKLSLQNRFYIPFLEDYVLAMELRGGILFSTKSIPVSRAFILGGHTTIRGYDGNIEGERIPNSTDVHIDTANESLKLRKTTPVTSSQYGLVKLEIRFPLLQSFKGSIFYDAGGVYLKGAGDSLLDLGHSAGIGFRYETFFPIGLDFAYKLPPKKGKDFRFHFAIGLF